MLVCVFDRLERRVARIVCVFGFGELARGFHDGFHRAVFDCFATREKVLRGVYACADRRTAAAHNKTRQTSDERRVCHFLRRCVLRVGIECHALVHGIEYLCQTFLEGFCRKVGYKVFDNGFRTSLCDCFCRFLCRRLCDRGYDTTRAFRHASRQDLHACLGCAREEAVSKLFRAEFSRLLVCFLGCVTCRTKASDTTRDNACRKGRQRSSREVRYRRTCRDACNGREARAYAPCHITCDLPALGRIKPFIRVGIVYPVI